MSRALRPGLACALALALIGASLAWLVPASGAQAQERVVSDVPAKGTPDVLGDANKQHVYAVAKVGNTIVLGGTFSKVSPAGSDRKLNRHNIVAFNAKTGKVSKGFAPRLDGRVHALAPAPGGDAVFVGGQFTNVNGNRSPMLAKLDLGTGKAADGFRVPDVNGKVRDLEVSGGRLYVAGAFKWVNEPWRPKGKQTNYHQRMVTLDPGSGSVQEFFDIGFTGTHRGEFPHVREFDISPDGNRMVAIGNFDTVREAAAPGEDSEAPEIAHREQVAMVDLSGSSAALRKKWQTKRFQHGSGGGCYDAFTSPVRDVAFSPDGSYFAIVTTGGGAEGTLCDTATRWETGATGQAVDPTWVDRTGGDTLLSVAVTEGAIYIGGHQRWLNNSFGVDKAKAGAVARPGLAALDPANGLPLEWNPGRLPTGYGVTDMLVTERGLWIGSDTEWIGDFKNRRGNRSYKRERNAFFPFQGGTTVPQATSDKVPGDVYMVAPSANRNGSGATSTYRHYAGDSGGSPGAAKPAQGLQAGGLSANTVRGAMLLGETLWYGTKDGSFVRRSFDGEKLGEASTPDPYSGKLYACHEDRGADGEPPEGTCSSGKPSRFYNQIPDLTGLFYDSGRIYYTLEGKPKLFYRYFTPSSAVVGAKQFTADTAARWAQVEGMFRSGGDLYFAAASGKLHRVAFSDGELGGSPAVAEVSKEWGARALFLRHHVKSGSGSPSPDPTGSSPGTPTPTGEPTSPAPDPSVTATATSLPTPTGGGPTGPPPGDGNDGGDNPGDGNGNGNNGNGNNDGNSDGDDGGPDPGNGGNGNGGNNGNNGNHGGGPGGGTNDGGNGNNAGTNDGNNDAGNGGNNGDGGQAGDSGGDTVDLVSSGAGDAGDTSVLPNTGFEYGLVLAVALASFGLGVGFVVFAGRRFGMNGS